VIVVDASVAVKWVLDEKGSDAAFALRTETITAPALWLIEAANALWATAARGQISPVEAEERLVRLRSAPVEMTPVEDDLAAALRIANRLHHPIYDCLYLAVAVRLDTHVVTADRRFVQACAKDKGLRQRVKLLDGA
jgi:predicted nucleic acid-binding protein